MALKQGNIVKRLDESGDRLWIVLRSRNTGKLILCGGLWYGRDPMSEKSYGKMIDNYIEERLLVVYKSCWCKKLKYLKSIL
ncbi:hypothetical protein [Butyricimonas synergistica]|uniref:hypothetical protein n=1 Tax=Butyricimonas synergistica TaxID=544644 RepID=UPI0022E2CE7A|nr:hypothetical protein [Butyricimonas synergistica]